MITTITRGRAGEARPIRTHPFGWMTPVIASALEERPERIFDWLGASRAELHFAGLVFALCESDVARAAIEPDLFVLKKRKVLEKVAPDVPITVIALTAKLSGGLWRPQSYRFLAECCRKTPLLMALRKMRRIERRKLMAFASLPEALQQPFVYERLRNRSDAKALVFALTVVERMRPDLSMQEILRSLENAGPKVSVEVWVRRQTQPAFFPDPPWQGTERLKPIRNWEQLKEVALAFDNCVRTYVHDIRTGTSFLYVYEDEQGLKACVEFERMAPDLWAIGEINGVANKPLKASERQRVIDEAAGAALVMPDCNSAERWLNPHW
ncbi:hypothetical protein HK107_13740 [Parvularcula sp. ZS-1/3]|uniref:Uncharacterized protein n=1 Tax=Parvularcula mediterranea TaxID=2732508 RepID=A0A7Y3RNL4_9PROT|nr:hypothetical protein [Parvularcula mediterranea]NNU17389.1 hypothetical protein [Parvularcula mediterranea]